jgi:hypothetical protein
MMVLFKGELTYNDIMYGMPKKRLFDLRLARINRLISEHEEMEKQRKAEESKQIRENIMRPQMPM